MKYSTQLIEARWWIYASVKRVFFASGNGSSNIHRQPITRTSCDLLSTGLLRTYIDELENKSLQNNLFHIRIPKIS